MSTAVDIQRDVPRPYPSRCGSQNRADRPRRKACWDRLLTVIGLAVGSPLTAQQVAPPEPQAAPAAAVQPDQSARPLDSAAIQNAGRMPAAAMKPAAAIKPADHGDAIEAWLQNASSSTTSSVSPLIKRPSARRASAGPGRAATASSGWSGVVGMAWPLLVVLGLITAVVLVFRRFLHRTSPLGSTGAIKILARHYLSPKQSLCLVRLGRRVLLLGITPDQIRTVAEVNQAEEVSGIVAALERNRPGSFTSLFTRLTEQDLDKQVDSPPVEGAVTVASQRLAGAGARLKDLLDRVRQLSSGTEASAEPT